MSIVVSAAAVAALCVLTRRGAGAGGAPIGWGRRRAQLGASHSAVVSVVVGMGMWRVGMGAGVGKSWVVVGQLGIQRAGIG